jgi:nucleobase:cation symporter-1, NCS1 family
MAASGRYNYDGSWNHKALLALAISGVLSIGLSLAGAYGLMFNVGDWGWLIGAGVGALAYRALSAPALASAMAPAGR